ncbi:MAG: branched-chain amino acid ABC transporter substrate-binding protein [Mesorhizobium sp.]|uniref:branched-chain amino acid ABC transporter substrate-binding protein n=1 Tax=unclassified Mesorhizobium TaxID=325217 RepID=UPI000F74DE1B|nr:MULTISPECIES: branched-chain amino acid ABC transporter substrate-binding protein [unclassified Mesorhizobium]TGV92254.1 branched-chain amino acid ABC transporter substrate-binding protein [Mesorhizobium sp. M00.F.Ca.ET.158.01.1.1]AZO58321.1 branched-chain amino acid ABC transporter substrate-binding protein [Mesorhizobium sp. M1A.F.Ca.IN.022.06.1.1]MCT2579593.1 branched-chain amino acid ABC transporter substrate-binding protein [Mesorhizobium sp. P13.3]MDF3168231.1 branched-chain amino acid
MTMRMILRLMTAALMAAAAGVARADIVLGVAGPMSGPNAAYGEQYRVGVETAIQRINANGGVLGQKLSVSVGDDVSDPKQGVSVANKFVADGVHYVVGHYNSGVTIPASEIYAENGVLFVTPTATNPMVTERGLWDAFRACGRDDQQGIIAAKFVLERFAGKKVAIVDDKSTAGKGLADEMAKAYNSGGGKEVLREEINPGEKDYSALVAKIKESGADLVYYGGQHTEAGLIVRQMHDQGVKTVLMGGDGISNSEFGAIGGDGAAGTLMTSFPDPASFPEAKDAVADLKAKNVPTEAVTLYAYAATQILAEAIAKAKVDDPKAASDYLHSGAPIPTVLGTISYDDKGDIKQPGFVVFEWRKVDGKLVPVALK